MGVRGCELAVVDATQQQHASDGRIVAFICHELFGLLCILWCLQDTLRAQLAAARTQIHILEADKVRGGLGGIYSALFVWNSSCNCAGESLVVLVVAAAVACRCVVRRRALSWRPKPLSWHATSQTWSMRLPCWKVGVGAHVESVSVGVSVMESDKKSLAQRRDTY